MIDIFGTLGPSCSDEDILEAMFSEGMTGIRINLSHVKLSDCREQVAMINKAASKVGTAPKILIDMQGPELRVGELGIYGVMQRLLLWLQERLQLENTPLMLSGI